MSEEALRNRIAFLEKSENECHIHISAQLMARCVLPPGEGWERLGLALKEALDERDALRAADEYEHKLPNDDSVTYGTIKIGAEVFTASLSLAEEQSTELGI